MRLRVWFFPDVTGYIKEKIWHKIQEIQHRASVLIIFEAVVAGTDEIKFWLPGWGARVVVLEPDFLRDEIWTEAESVLNKYEKEEEKEEEMGCQTPR
jgi:predicted DNA-binding transcriptional regulator YafY